MPGKAVSKAQFRFFHAVKSGSLKAPGLSAGKAGEMLGHQSPKGLPEEAGEPKMSPRAEHMEEMREHSGPTKVVARLFNRKRKH